MDITEIEVKSALVKSRIPGVEFVVNPYLGCAHGCGYCYAVFMRKHSRSHSGSPWGSFVEVKINLPDILEKEIRRKKRRGNVLLSSVCDPYQPAEARYELTGRCVRILGEAGWGFDILTRSPLAVRDIDVFSSASNVSVGFSIPTDSEDVRKVLEPNAPPIPARIMALKKLREAGVSTYAFIGPMLPMDPVKLHAEIEPFVDHVLIDALNYRNSVRGIYAANGWEYQLTNEYADKTGSTLARLFGSKAGWA